MTHFSTIGLIGHLNNERAVYSIKRLIRFLQQRNKAFVLEAETAALITDAGMVAGAQQIMDMETLGQVCDLVIVVGGDGSLLRGARALAQYQVPLLGVNRGRLGFLTDITPEDIENKVEEVLSGKFTSEKRFLLDMEVMRAGQLIDTADALNDVVLHPGKFIHMLQFEIYVDGVFVTSQRSDGVIVATPTGSTAYSLSVGGPLMHPAIGGWVMAPIAPHTLSNRPIVLPESSEISIEIVAGRYVSANFDMQSLADLILGDRIVVKRSEHRVRFLHPAGWNYFDTLRKKMHWNEGA